MDFHFTPEEERFRAEVRAFVEREWGPPDPHGGRDHPREREMAFRRRCAEAGYVTLGWPAEYGGRSVGPMERYLLSQEMNRCGAPFPLYIANVIGPLVIRYGNEQLKAELLPRIASGEVNFVLGFSEPSAGSDLASLQTRAERVDGGYRVYGQKMYGLPYDNEIMYLAVRTDPEAPIRSGITILLPDAQGEGFEVTRQSTMTRHDVGATYYDGLFVPEYRRLGEENGGWDLIREALDLDRFGGIPYTHFRTLLVQLAEWARTHARDGAPLAQQPWVRDQVGRLAVEVEGAELIQDMAAWKVAAGHKLRIEASIVKAYCTELERRLVEFGAELVGPLAALTKDADVDPLVGALNFLYRLNVAMTIVGGTNEIQRNIIALQGLGLPREPDPARR